MEKQKDNPKFSFLFGGEFYSYYKCKLALEQQQRESSPAFRPPHRAIPFSDSSAFSATNHVLGRLLFFWGSWEFQIPSALPGALQQQLLGPSVMEDEVIDPLPGLGIRGSSIVLQM